jgi:hypothetical protein
MEVLGHEYNPNQWRLFIDSSKVSANVVLLRNGNRFPSIPLAHAAKMKESYESIWKSLSMKNLSGSYVVISRLWHCYQSATWVHKTLLFPVRVTQLGQEELLCK